MAPSAVGPTADASVLPKADGSATFSHRGYTVTAAVNGPIEAPKRDESAFEAQVDVIVRPAAGVGGTAERRMESMLQSALRQLMTIASFPRCMVQVTLQVLEMPENAYASSKLLQAQVNLAMVPALLHAAVLGLLSAAVPLKSIATAVTLAFVDAGVGSEDGSVNMAVNPDAREAERAASVHVCAFTSDAELLMAESCGSFSLEQWERVLQASQRICCRGGDEELDTVMSGDDKDSTSVKALMRSVMESQA